MLSTERQTRRSRSIIDSALGISELDHEPADGSLSLASGVPQRRLPGIENLEVLVPAARILAAANSPAEALDQLAHLVLPAFGDFAVVVVPRDHELHVIAAAHRDPSKDVVARLLLGRVPVAPAGGSPSAQAFRTGLPVNLGGLTTSDVTEWFGDDAYREWAQNMGLRAVLAMPLSSRGSRVGVMTFGVTENGDPSRLDPEAVGPLVSLVAIVVQQAVDAFATEELKAAFREKPVVVKPSSNPAVLLREVLIVDPLSVAREGIRSLLGSAEGLSVCGEALGIQDACELECRPDVIVTSLVLEDCTGPQVVTRLLDAFPTANLLVVSRVDRPLLVHLALACGAKGYVLKSAPLAEVLDAVCQVSKGEPYVQPLLGASLAKWQSSLSGRIEGGKLTQREREVLGLVALGHTNAGIASIIGVSLRTVETHRSHLVHKLGVHSRADLVALATELTIGAG